MTVSEHIKQSSKDVKFNAKVDGVLTTEEMQYFNDKIAMDHFASAHTDVSAEGCTVFNFFLKIRDELRKVPKGNLTYWTGVQDERGQQMVSIAGSVVEPFILADYVDGNGDGTTTPSELISYRINETKVCTPPAVIFDIENGEVHTLKVCMQDEKAPNVQALDTALINHNPSFALGVILSSQILMNVDRIIEESFGVKPKKTAPEKKQTKPARIKPDEGTWI